MAWGDASAGAEEPPPNQPPTAWPMEEPTATPLGGVSDWSSFVSWVLKNREDMGILGDVEYVR